MMKNIVLIFAWWTAKKDEKYCPCICMGTAKNSEKYCPYICMVDCEK